MSAPTRSCSRAVAVRRVHCWAALQAGSRRSRPQQRVGAARLSDSSRRFFDSLAVERQRDSVRAVSARVLARPIGDASVNSVGLARHHSRFDAGELVDGAASESKPAGRASRASTSIRADVGIARAPLVPSVTRQRQRRTQSGGARRISADVVSRGAIHRRPRVGAGLLGPSATRRRSGERRPRRAGGVAARDDAVARERRRDQDICNCSSSIRSAPSPSER